MPKRVGIVPRNILVDAPLPSATKTYTVISHEFVITNTIKLLTEKGFAVTNEKYTCNDGAQVASGLYHINYGDDPDLGMLFAFSNSYDKSLRFRCAIGAYVKLNEMSVLGDTSSAWGRKHTGTADDETLETIEQQIDNAAGYFKQLAADKEVMKKIKLTKREYAELLGRLYIDIKMLSGEQLRIVKKEYEKPSFNYTTDADSLWALYNHILVALSKCHPRTWMEQQKVVHLHLMAEYKLAKFDDEEAEVKDPNQLNIIDAIDAVESTDTYAPSYNEDLGEDEKPDLDAEEDADWDKLEKAGVIKPVVETDTEYAERVAEIEGEPETTVQEIVQEQVEKVVNEEHAAVATNGETALPKAEPLPEALPEAPAPAPVPEADAPKPTITMKEAVEKYGHLVTEDERATLLQGKGPEEALNKLKAAYLADQEKVSQEVETETKPEESVEESVEEPVAKAVLPTSPTQSPLETPEVMSANEESEDVEIEGEFFMTKNDLDSMYEGVTLELGFVVSMMDKDFEITTCDPNSNQYGLTELSLPGLSESDTVTSEPVVIERDSEGNALASAKMVVTDFSETPNTLAEKTPAILGAESPEEEAQVMEALADVGLAKPVEEVKEAPVEAVVVDDMEEIEAVDVTDESFEIGDPEVALPAESMLKSTSVKEDLAPEPTEADKAITATIDREIEELYGAKIPFTYELNDDQYNVKLETGETFVMTESYLNTLKDE